MSKKRQNIIIFWGALCISLSLSSVSYAGIYTYDPALSAVSDQAFQEMADCGCWHMDFDGDWELTQSLCNKLTYSFLGASGGRRCTYEKGDEVVEVELIMPTGVQIQEEVAHHFEAAEYVKAAAAQTGGMSSLEKARWIHDYVCNLVNYDYEGLERENTGQGKASRSVYDAFTSHRAVCEGYSRTFYVIAGAAGLPVRIVSGKVNGEGHSWNEVNVDGIWKYVDCTWDDQDYGIIYKYFLADITYDNSWAQ